MLFRQGLSADATGKPGRSRCFLQQGTVQTIRPADAVFLADRVVRQEAEYSPIGEGPQGRLQRCGAFRLVDLGKPVLTGQGLAPLLAGVLRIGQQ